MSFSPTVASHGLANARCADSISRTTRSRPFRLFEQLTATPIECTVGDATDLAEHPDGSFDVAFSNSVIEHLFFDDPPHERGTPSRRAGSRGPSGAGSRTRSGQRPAQPTQHRLMRRHELVRLFPDATIVGEKIGGLTKSWTAYGGFPQPNPQPEG